MNKKSTFAVMFGNRGFFPGSLISSARQDMVDVLQRAGYGVLLMDESLTRFGGVETVAEGKQFAAFLESQRGKFDGVILSLPNFGDENGAITALQDAGVPIFVQAYPDDLDKMSPEQRRDAFCGKLSVMDVFYQNNLKFSVYKPHTVHPTSPAFLENVDRFDRVCQVVKGMKRMTVGAIGARTTPFKTVRVDEVALQRRGVTVETYDMADIIGRVNALSLDAPACKAKADVLRKYTSWIGVPPAAFENITRLGVVLDQVVEEANLDAMAVRCWLELQKQLGISVCVLMGEMNNRGISAACEVDVANAVMMHAMQLASSKPAALLDWNNNYADDEDRCILFHCGPVAVQLMQDAGHIEEHAILMTTAGKGCSYGCQVGRIAPMNFTFGSLLTDSGSTKAYLGKGKFTKDPIPGDFFGCAGVAKIDRLQDVLLHIGRNGFRHHVGITPGDVQDVLQEALGYYLGYEISLPQSER